MIELKHYVANWKIFNASMYYGGFPEAIFRQHERFLTREEAEKKVAEELEKFKNCEVSHAEWFIKDYLNNINEHFYIEESNEIY